MADVEGLNDEQREVAALAVDGVNIFYTGNAGTGKTLLLRKIISLLKKKHGTDFVGVTATTGIAAIQIGDGGQTIHSWAGIGLGKGSRYQLLQQVISNNAAHERWSRCKTLVIDEISMLNQDAFDTLEFVGRKVRNSNERFGGIQLILSGDFEQLPPVISIKELSKSDQDQNANNIPFCFKSPKWSACVDVCFKLTHVFRQRDPELLLLLDEIRQGGTLSPTAHHLLDKLKRKESVSISDRSAVFLYPLRREVNEKNDDILKSLPTAQYVSKAKDTGNKDGLRDCPFPETLVYKVGARVMLLRNIHKLGLANGSIGSVMAVAGGKPLVRFDSGQVTSIEPYVWGFENEDGVTISTRRQLPLHLAWAVTIHKSQGQTLPNVVVSLKGIFAYGQAYVALSRATSLEGLSVLRGWDHEIPGPPKAVTEFQKSIKRGKEYETVQKKVPQEDEAEINEILDQGSSVASPEGARISLQWSDGLALPASISTVEILAKMEQQEGRNEEYQNLCRSLQSRDRDEDQEDHLYKFTAHCWEKIEDVYVATGTATADDIRTAVDKSKLEEKAKQFMALQRSRDLKDKWTELLISQKILPPSKTKLDLCHLTAFIDILEILRTHMACLMLGKTLSEAEAAVALTADFSLDSAEQAKVRYLAGWALSKVRNAAQRYMERNKGSSNATVILKLSDERKLVEAVQRLLSSRDEAIRSTKIPETLQFIENHNRGALTHVCDNAYLFFVQLEKICHEKFSSDLIAKYQRDGLTVARKLYYNAIKELGMKIFVATLNITEDLPASLADVLLRRIMKRYLNMRSKEFLKKLKRDVKVTKDKALRQALTEKKSKAKTSEGLKKLLNHLVDDTSNEKIAGHLRMKAHALTRKDAFIGYTKGQLCYLFLVYGLQFLKSRKKKALSEQLHGKVISVDRVACPEILTKSKFNNALCYYNEGRKVDLVLLGITTATAEDQASANADEPVHRDQVRQIVDNPTRPAEPRQRLKKFKPSIEQEQILRADNERHAGKVPKVLRLQRAAEFGVNESQVQRWHNSFNKTARATIGPEASL